jgi:DNA-binding SARP family transcriptional activator/tetratricopeptide (TPR) repeat protein
MLELRVLGSLDLRDSAGAEVRAVLAQPKRLALLAYLAVHGGGGFHRRDTLLALFWPESDTERARGALRRALYVLRQALGEGVLVSRGDNEVGLGAGLWCDAAEFGRRLAAGAPADALTLYRGDLLDGFFVPDAPAFEEWLAGERRRSREQAAAAAWAVAAAAEKAGERDDALRFAHRAVILAGGTEPAVRRQMELSVRIGDPTGALQAHDALVARLARDYGVAPAPETQALAAAVRATLAAAPPSVSVATEPFSEPRSLDAGFATAGPDPADPTSAAPTSGAPAPLQTERAAEPERVVRPVEAVPTDGGTVIAADPPAVAGPGPARAIRGRLAGRGRPGWRMFVSVACVAMVLVGALLFRLRPARAADARPSVVAVLPFTYDGPGGAAYLGDGIMRLLSANLNGAGPIRTVDPGTLLTAFRSDRALPGSADAGRALAARFGAGAVVQGQIVEAGGRLRITAALAQGTADRREVTVEGPADRVLDLVDDLTARLLSVYSAGSGARLTGVAALTTRSLPALKAYLDGEARLHDGRYGEAVAAFERATAADTAFGLAYVRLATAARWLNDFATADSARARAQRFGSRLPRREQLVLRAWALDASGEPLAAERLYRAALDERPDDVETWLQLGEVLFHWGPSVGREAGAARGAFERVVSYEPGHAGALTHLVRLAALRGDTGAVAGLARRVVALRPAEDQVLEVETLAAAVRRDGGALARLTTRLASAPSEVVLRTATMAAVFAGDVDAAERVVALLDGPTREPGWRARGRLLRAELAMAGGRWRAAQQALAALDRFPGTQQYLSGTEYAAALAGLPFLPLPAEEIRARREAVAGLPQIASIAPGAPGWDAPQAVYAPHRLYLLARLTARLGDTVAALAEARRLDAYTGSTEDRAMAHRLARGVRAHVAWLAGRPGVALGELAEPGVWPDRRLPRPENYPKDDERFLYAELLRAAGRTEEALRWLATFPDPTGSDLVYLAPSHLRRAELYDALGRRAEAAAHYRRVVALWRDCDAELRPARERAERRLAELGGAAPASTVSR